MRSLFLSSAVFIFIIAAAGIVRGEVIDKISIVVNDEVITEGEIDRMLMPAYEKYKFIYKGDDLMRKLGEVRQEVVEQLISDKLMLSEARREKIIVDDKEVTEKMDEAAGNFQSKKQFESALAQQHITIKDLRQKYWEQFMVRKVVDKMVASKISMTPVDVSNYYNSHPEEFSTPAEVVVWHIMIKPDPVNPQKRYEFAQNILNRIREGGDFAGLAKLYSEGPNASAGGYMGSVKKGELMPEMENIIFSMKEGEISDVVQTSLGYHIFRVDSRKEAGVLPFKEARRKAEEAVFRDKIQTRVREWVENLKKNAYIAFK